MITSHNSEISECSSMLFDQQRQFDDFFMLQASGAEIDSDDNLLDQNNNDKNDKKNENIWRVWLGPEENGLPRANSKYGDNEYNKLDDPLLTIWKWAGTMKYIHLEWIKHWLDSKIHK